MTNVVKRPQRWETPFCFEMTPELAAEVLARPPFSNMNQASFPEHLPLEAILRNDAAVRNYAEGEIVIREGDYGNSAFLVLEGSVRVVLKRLPRESLGRSPVRQAGWLETLGRWWRSSKYPEVRRLGQDAQNRAVAPQESRIFLQDVPGLLAPDATAEITAGEVFGELAALTRSPRTATVIAGPGTRLLEIRWQGLRDILRYDSAWREHIDQLYRQNSLRVHLRETPIFSGLSTEAIQEIAEATRFATYGNFDWHAKFMKAAERDPRDRIEFEPLIAAEGEYPDGLILIRSGFARVTKKLDHGERTISYLGKGECFGLSSLLAARGCDGAAGWETSLRAVGYVDVLRIPTPLVEKWILPSLTQSPKAGECASHCRSREIAGTDTNTSAPRTELLEFLMEKRFINGAQAMVIDLEKCTRCDDCVRACAAVHDNNPRFNREGPRFDRFQVAQACMHCVDPVCMIGCPTGAIHRDSDTGTVVINDGTCIGCSTCANSCPYSNIRMVEIRNEQGEQVFDLAGEKPILKATKCDMCTGTLAGPACVRACPHDALVRVDLHDSDSLGMWSRP